jgi:hypothetical protein
MLAQRSGVKAACSLASMQPVIPAHTVVSRTSSGERLGFHEKNTLATDVSQSNRRENAERVSFPPRSSLSLPAYVQVVNKIYILAAAAQVYREKRRWGARDALKRIRSCGARRFHPSRGAVTATSPKSSQEHGNPLGKGRFRWTGEINGAASTLDTYHLLKGTFF